MTHLLTKPGESEKAEGCLGEISHAQAKLEMFIGQERGRGVCNLKAKSVYQQFSIVKES